MAQILRTSRWLRGASLGVLLVAQVARGQAAASAELQATSLTGSQTSSPTRSQTNSQTVTDVLHQMSDRADVIFAGQVLAVRRPDAGSMGAGVVEVDFRVDQAIRSCTAGTIYTLREWGGLWVAGSQRYRVGQRLLMLLHAPSAGGMSSPVDGLDGAIPIRQGSTATPLAATTAPPSAPFVDLRWLGVKVQRAISYRTAPGSAADPARHATTAQQQTAYAALSGTRNSVGSIIVPLGNASPSAASIPAQEASVDAVLGMLKIWQKAPNVAP
jgi:hypothetical protein